MSYCTRQMQGLNEVFSCLQVTSDCVNCIMAASRVDSSLRQRGQVINIPKLSMSIVTMEGEIVDVNVRLIKACCQTAIFQNIVKHSLKNFQRPG